MAAIGFERRRILESRRSPALDIRPKIRILNITGFCFGHVWKHKSN